MRVPKIVLAGLVALLSAGCGLGALQGGTFNPTPPVPPDALAGIVLNLSAAGPADPALLSVDLIPDTAPALHGVHVAPGRFAIAVPAADAGQGAWLVGSAPGFVGYRQRVQVDTCGSALPIPSHGSHEICGFTLAPLFPPTPPRETVIADQWTFEGLTCNTEQFGPLPMFDPFYISLTAADRKHWRDCHKAAGDATMLVGFYAEYGEDHQPYGSGQLVPPTDLTGNWPRYRAIVKETRSDGLQTVLYMSGDNGLEYLEWAMPFAVNALRPQPDDPADLADGQEFFACFDSCVPGYQPPSRVNESILFMRGLVTQREIISDELAAGYSSWCGGAAAMVTIAAPAECGSQDYNSEAGQQLDKIYVEYPLWPIPSHAYRQAEPDHGDQIWQINARLSQTTYVRPPEQPDNDDPPPYPNYLQKGTPRGPFMFACMEKIMYGWVRWWYSLQDVIDQRAYFKARGCPMVN